jgi:hypothetical protein
MKITDELEIVFGFRKTNGFLKEHGKKFNKSVLVMLFRSSNRIKSSDFCKVIENVKSNVDDVMFSISRVYDNEINKNSPIIVLHPNNYSATKKGERHFLSKVGAEESSTSIISGLTPSIGNLCKNINPKETAFIIMDGDSKRFSWFANGEFEEIFTLEKLKERVRKSVNEILNQMNIGETFT